MGCAEMELGAEVWRTEGGSGWVGCGVDQERLVSRTSVEEGDERVSALSC
jgi:hypothetical protein